MINNLWGDEFAVEDVPAKTKEVIRKIKTEKKETAELSVEKAIRSKKLSIEDKLQIVERKVFETLGKQRENVIVLSTKVELHNYLEKGLAFGRIAIDTETNNSLDPLTCKLMGLCLYVSGEKQAYIPVNHVDRETGLRLANQLTEKDIEDELNYLISNKGNCVFVFHNGKFDYEVLKCTCKVEVPVDWDTMVGAKLLDENEQSAGLKWQYINKIDPEQSKYDIENLFEKLPYEIVDPDLFALYAATDAMMTDRLYEYQRRRFEEDPSLEGTCRVFKNIEIPLIPVVAKIELRGVAIDTEYDSRLSEKYRGLLTRLDEDIQAELRSYDGQLRDYLARTPNTKIKSPLNLDSPIQLAEFLYDVLKLPQVNIKKPRGTGEEELTRLNEKTHLRLCSLILERRNVAKLLNTFVDKLPLMASPVDHRIHCEFNANRTVTGRFASKNPNLQNIPAHNKEIRMLFSASEGCSLVGADYSAQEVRMAAFTANDTDMIDAYKKGKDLYAVIAAVMYRNRYEDNLEFYPAGTKIMFEGQEVVCGEKTHTNPEGKMRRQSAKSVLIGSLYGRGAASIAEQLNQLRPADEALSVQDAQDIMDKFYRGFPRITKWMDESVAFARKHGYIDDWYGRRRHLPDILLPRYEVEDIAPEVKVNPFLECADINVKEKEINNLKRKLNEVKMRREVKALEKEANSFGLRIKDNTGFISQAERQSINFQAQGGGAELVKLAMIRIDSDPVLNSLGFGLLLTIHDEVIGECPSVNAEKAAKRLTEIMIGTALDNHITVPMKCDATITHRWYEDEMVALLNEELAKAMKEEGCSREEAMGKIKANHCELLPNEVEELLEQA